MMMSFPLGAKKKKTSDGIGLGPRVQPNKLNALNLLKRPILSWAFQRQKHFCQYDSAD
jgi:hypothetical protein